MKPTKPGFWWYNDRKRYGWEPVRVWSTKRYLYYEQFTLEKSGLIDETDDADWGPEIKMGENVDND